MVFFPTWALPTTQYIARFLPQIMNDVQNLLFIIAHIRLYAADHGQDAHATSEHHTDKGNSQRGGTGILPVIKPDDTNLSPSNFLVFFAEVAG